MSLCLRGRLNNVWIGIFKHARILVLSPYYFCYMLYITGFVSSPAGDVRVGRFCFLSCVGVGVCV